MMTVPVGSGHLVATAAAALASLDPVCRLRVRPRPGILLDRDGIIVDYGYVGSVDRVQLIAGSAEAIAEFNRADVPVAVVTNQAGIRAGFYGVDDVDIVHRHIAAQLADHGAHIDLYLYCPYHPAGVIAQFARSSDDRKPGPGMATRAQAALNLDLPTSWVVGDRPEDVGMAEAVGASAIYLGTNPPDRPRVWSFATLAAAAPFILDRVAAWPPSMTFRIWPQHPVVFALSFRLPPTTARPRSSMPMRSRPRKRLALLIPSLSMLPPICCLRLIFANARRVPPAGMAARPRPRTTCSATT